MANQVVEYTGLDFTHTSEAFGSTFFVMIGFRFRSRLGRDFVLAVNVGS